MKPAEKIQYINTYEGPVNYRKGRKGRNVTKKELDLHKVATLTSDGRIAKEVASRRIEQGRRFEAKLERAREAEELKLAKEYIEEDQAVLPDIDDYSNEYFDELSEKQLKRVNELEAEVSTTEEALNKTIKAYAKSLKESNITDVKDFEQLIEDAIYYDSISGHKKGNSELVKLAKKYPAVELYEEKKSLNAKLSEIVDAIDNIYVYGDEKGIKTK